MVGRGASLFAIVLAAAGCGRWHFEDRPLRDTDADQPDALSVICPAGFIAIAGNPGLGTTDFCIMLFEAKAWLDLDADAVVDDSELATTGCDPICSPDGLATHTPVAVPDATPWHDISAALAQDRCRSLGPDYDLLSNREWMTVARLAESNRGNWSSGVPGSGRIYEGSTDAAGTGGAATLGDPYAGTGHTASDPIGNGWEAKRTLQLTDALEIWDLAGNKQEWVDWTIGGALDPSPPCPGATRELSTVAASCTGYSELDYAPELPALSSANGIGLFIGSSNAATRRGGQVGDRSLGIAGIYGFNNNRGTNEVFSATGFRCVYRPPP